MAHFWRDLIYSARSLMRAPMLTATIVLTIGVGLGATTGMLGVIRAVLLNPLPYADADEIYWIYTDNAPFRFRFSVVDYRAFEADHPAFSEIAAYQNSRVTVTEGGQSERVLIRSVTGSYFPLLRQRPRFGRLFEPADDTGGDRLAVLTTPYWTRRFGADPAVLGRSMTSTAPATPSSACSSRRAARWNATSPSSPPRAGRCRSAKDRSSPWRSPGSGADVAPAAALETLRATNARLFPDLEILVPGREGDLGPAGSEVACHRRGRSDAPGRARRGGMRAADRLCERGQSARRARPRPQSRAGDSRRARRVTRPARPTSRCRVGGAHRHGRGGWRRDRGRRACARHHVRIGVHPAPQRGSVQRPPRRLARGSVVRQRPRHLPGRTHSGTRRVSPAHERHPADRAAVARPTADRRGSCVTRSWRPNSRSRRHSLSPPCSCS